VCHCDHDGRNVKALVYGKRPEEWTCPDPSNRLLAALEKAPMRLMDTEPPVLRPGWVTLKTRMTGICGSDAKQVFMDFGEGLSDSPLNGLFSFPTVLGHEVVADVAEVGPHADGISQGDRVVLNPWLSCIPRGIDPVCASCETGDYSLCYHFTEGDLAPGIHTGTCRDAPGGMAEMLPAHCTMVHRVPDSVPDELAVFADPFSVSLHSVTRHPPTPGGRALVYGAGALGTTANAILHALYPGVEVGVVAGHPSQAELARRLGATVFAHEPVEALIEEIARWSGGKLRRVEGALPMAHPGGIDVVYDTIGTSETSEVGVRVLAQRGTLVKSGVNAPERWEWSPLYFKEISWVGSNAFGYETVDGDRKHGIDHYLDLVRDGRIDLTGMLTHTFELDDWREAFTALATQDDSGAIKIAFDFR
jgi:threonine dehydrogenase-like Zn-dependent dehydrogenase